VSVRWVWAFLDLPEEGFDTRAEFWCQVTRTALSPWRGERGEFATLIPAQGDPWVKVQRVGGTGGVHVDLEVDVPLELARDHAVGLGAALVRELDDVVVCRSPGGLAFCLTAWTPGEVARGQVREGQDSLLDQVCVDIPPSRYAAEVAFWSGLTGWVVEGGAGSEFERLEWPRGMPLRFLLQRLDDDEGPVRAHVDLACRDADAEAARHVSLGAVVAGPGRGWVVMRDPGGMAYCCTGRDPLSGRVKG
jgi:hypothetical protein